MHGRSDMDEVPEYLKCPLSNTLLREAVCLPCCKQVRTRTRIVAAPSFVHGCGSTASLYSLSLLVQIALSRYAVSCPLALSPGAALVPPSSSPHRACTSIPLVRERRRGAVAARQRWAQVPFVRRPQRRPGRGTAQAPPPTLACTPIIAWRRPTHRDRCLPPPSIRFHPLLLTTVTADS
jgi:hypothetical protein